MEESILSADELYIADDLYESLTEEKQKILSNMSQMNLDKLHNDKSNKLNKLKLLLYQKFLNILFVILAQNFQGNLKQAMEKLKLGKIRGYKIQTNNKKFKFPEFYLQSLIKQEQRKETKEKIKQIHVQKTLEGKSSQLVKPSKDEIEYKRYRDQVRLGRIQKEEKKKFEMDLIKKEAYASNLYDFILKRKAFQLLYTNKELNSVMLLFLQSLNKRLMKIRYLDLMNVLSHNRRESRKKLDELKISNAEKFYLLKLKWRIFEYLLNFSELSCKVQNYFIKRFRIKKRKRVFKLLDLAISITKKEDDERSKQISLFNYRRIYHNKIFSMLKEHTEDSKDEKLKLNLIEKLKLKADSLLNY